jgi:hypothetical protein
MVQDAGPYKALPYLGQTNAVGGNLMRLTAPGHPGGRYGNNQGVAHWDMKTVRPTSPS